jgi:hypothetical protein
MEALYSSKTLISTFKSTRRYNPEDQHRRVQLFWSATAISKQTSMNFTIFLKDVYQLHYQSVLQYAVKTNNKKEGDKMQNTGVSL